ncbi:MAG: hypothetical protein GX832_03360 [Clostridiales bacterium]|nr:hypothetical protein [Clostridiales bacterium]
MPGIAADFGQTDPDLIAPGVLKQIEKNLLIDIELKLSQTDEVRTVSGLLVAWRKQPDLVLGDDTDKEIVADQILAIDQLYFGQVLLESGSNKKFKQWRRNFKQAFFDDNSRLFVNALEREDSNIFLQNDPNWITTQDYMRLLLLAYLERPTKDLSREISDLSGTLLPLFLSGPPTTIEGYGPDLNHPLISKAADDPLPSEQKPIPLISVESIDFWTCEQLSAFDLKWAEIANSWKSRLEEYQYEVGMPFPPEGWSPADRDLMPLIESGFQAETWRMLRTSIHLAEVGVMNEDFISFILGELNNGPLAASYHLLDGSVSEKQTDPALAAWSARLGRACDNRSLFSAAAKQLSRSYVSSQTNDFFGAFARRDEEGRLVIYALDQVLGLLALQ